ncbi:MAG TPA: hypothetical protein VK402_22045 [Blastococcus sp.]|nr:hypothetical protein [Blastococcus sp.]
MITDTAVLPTMFPAAPTPPLPRPTSRLRQLGVDNGYALVSFPVVVGFVVVTGLSVGVGLLVIWVGVAVLAATLLAARGLATV